MTVLAGSANDEISHEEEAMVVGSLIQDASGMELRSKNLDILYHYTYASLVFENDYLRY